MFTNMGGAYQRNVTPVTDGPGITVRRQQHSYLLPRERQKRRHALTIFGSLVKQRFVNNALFTFAGSFLKRMKQYLQAGWQQQQQYVPRTRLVSESTSGPTGEGDEEIVERVTSSKNQYRSQCFGCDLPRELLTLDFNTNANTRKRPDMKRPRGRPRRSIAGPTEKPRLKQHDNPKRSKCHRSDHRCQRSKTMSYRLKKDVMPETDDRVELSKVTGMGNQSPVVTCEEGTNQRAEHQSHQRKLTLCPNVCGFSTTDHSLGASRSENVPLFVNGLVNDTEKQVKRKRSSRLKSQAPTNANKVSPKKDARTERLETKSLSRQHPSKCVRPRQESKSSVTLLSQHPSKCLRPRQESRSSVTLLRPKVWQSNLSLSANPENVRDWPSLAELGRPKSVIKKAATEVVKRKYAGSGVRHAGQSLTDGINVESKHSVSGVGEKEPFRWTVQQQCSLNTGERTWASVAAQSLTGSLRVTSKHRPSQQQTHTSEVMENSPVCNSLSVVSLFKIRKPPMRSKLAYSVRLTGDHSKIKEKPTLGKFMAERQESAKLLKTFKCKTKMARRIGQKDHSMMLGIAPDKRKPRKGERSDKAHDNTAHVSTRQPGTCWQKICKVDQMPMVYSCATPPVIVLHEQAASEGDTNREFQLPATESFSGKTNVAVAADTPNSNTDVHPEVPTYPILLSDSLLSDSHDNQRDVTVVASSSSVSSSEIKAEMSAQVETEARSPKRVSVRYRALLRRDSSRLDAKTLTEMQTRNKKTNHLHDNKVATRERQRLQRQDRQTTHHDALRFHTPTCAEDCSQSREPGSATSICPYWLRSMPASRAFVPADTLGDMPSISDTDDNHGGSVVTNTSNNDTDENHGGSEVTNTSISDTDENRGGSEVTNTSNSDTDENHGGSEVTSTSNSDTDENHGGSEVTSTSNSDTDENHGGSEVTNTSKVKLASLTPCRHSERLRTKAKNMIRSTYLPRCSCLDGECG